MILKNSNYTSYTSLDEIKRSIPMYWREFDDYMALQRFVADEMDTINEAAIQILDNAFILRCDDETLAEIENFLKIYEIAGRVVERSVYVNSVLTSIGKLSVSKLQRWIKSALGQEPEITFITDADGNRILMFAFKNRMQSIPVVMKLISGRLPAGMLVMYVNRFKVDCPINMDAVVAMQTEETVIYSEPYEDEKGFEL